MNRRTIEVKGQRGAPRVTIFEVPVSVTLAFFQNEDSDIPLGIVFLSVFFDDFCSVEIVFDQTIALVVGEHFGKKIRTPKRCFAVKEDLLSSSVRRQAVRLPRW